MVVYTHTRLDSNEIFYVGIGKREKRAYSKHHRSNHWYNIVNKSEYSINIVHECETWDEACYTEKYLIGYYGRYDLGLGKLVNMTEGGDGVVGNVVSVETKAKMSAAQTGKKLSKEHRAKISAGLNNSLLVKEQVAKMSANNVGRKHLEETKAKISAALKGKKISPESIAKGVATKKVNRLLKNQISF